MGSPEFMAAWDEMCLKCAEHDAMTAAGIVVGEDGAVRWHGLTGAEIEAALRGARGYIERLERRYYGLGVSHPHLVARPETEDYAAVDALSVALAAAAGRGADGEASQ